MPKKTNQTKESQKSVASSESRGQSKASPQMNPERKDVFKMWTDSYSAMTKMWEDSYVNLYDPWVQSAGRLFDKAMELSKESSPEKYREFFDELTKSQQTTLSKLYPMPRPVTDKDTLEKFVSAAQRSNELMRSWTEQIRDNAAKTQEILASGAPPSEYSGFYEMWRKTYEKMFDDFLGLIVSDSTKEVFEATVGVPGVYLQNFAEVVKLWRDAYQNLYTPLMDASIKLSQRWSDISKGQATPESYRDFYDQWMNAYRESYERMFNIESGQPYKDVVENLMRSTDNAMTMYKSWISSMDKMSAKMSEVLSRSMDPQVYMEFYDLWVQTYEKALEDFFEYAPMMEPMKKMMEPMRTAVKAQIDAYANLSKNWMGAMARTMEGAQKPQEKAKAAA